MPRISDLPKSLMGIFGHESNSDRELRNRIAQIAYKPTPRKIEFEIMGKMLNDAETYDREKFIDLRDKTLLMLREFIELSNGQVFLFKDETTTSNSGVTEVVFIR